MPPPAPEAAARANIDTQLAAAGWLVQDRAEMNLVAGPASPCASSRWPTATGFADHMLFVKGKAVG